MESCGCEGKNCNLSKDDHRHGSRNAYINLHCKCASCREANNAYHRKAYKNLKIKDEFKARVKEEAKLRGLNEQELFDAVVDKGLSLLAPPQPLFVDEDLAVHGQSPT